MRVQALPLLHTPWAVLPVELLQGLTLALPWAAATIHIKHTAAPAAQATVQSLFSGLYTGAGAGAGGLLGGLVYSGAGAQALFLCLAGVLLAGWAGAAALLAADAARHRRQRQGWRPLAASEDNVAEEDSWLAMHKGLKGHPDGCM